MKIIDKTTPSTDYSQFKRGDLLEVQGSEKSLPRNAVITFTPYARQGKYGLVDLGPTNDTYGTIGDVYAWSSYIICENGVIKNYQVFADSIEELLKNLHFYSVKKADLIAIMNVKNKKPKEILKEIERAERQRK